MMSRFYSFFQFRGVCLTDRYVTLLKAAGSSDVVSAPYLWGGSSVQVSPAMDAEFIQSTIEKTFLLFSFLLLLTFPVLLAGGAS